jgi:hypothetical protein
MGGGSSSSLQGASRQTVEATDNLFYNNFIKFLSVRALNDRMQEGAMSKKQGAGWLLGLRGKNAPFAKDGFGPCFPDKTFLSFSVYYIGESADKALAPNDN